MKTSFIIFASVIFICILGKVPICQGSLLTRTSVDPIIYVYSVNRPMRFIIVDKSRQQFLLFEQDKELRLLQRYNCATGEHPGPKKVSGDAKTPEGIYFITEIYEDQKITVFGSRAFHLDYPNIFDTLAGHLGDGIFIHGTNKELSPYSTNGCITLKNGDLDELAPYLNIGTIPVIIVQTLSTLFADQQLAISRQDPIFHEIFNDLSLTFMGNHTENIEILYFIKTTSQAIASVSYNEFDGNLIKFQNHKRVYLSPAHQKAFRTLYAEQVQDNIPAILARHPIKNPVAPATKQPQTVTDMERKMSVYDFITKWKTAWERKDIETYINCYAPSFHSGKFNRDGWRAKKMRLNQKYAFIHVTLRNITISITAAGARVSFHQEYESDTYHNRTNKVLHLVNRDNKWLILEERI